MTIDDTKKKRPTITDVAERAGVAVGTVSRYMNGQQIRSGNRQQIEDAIEALGFRRNAAAMAMKNARTGIIGFLVPTFDDFHAELMGHLARIFRQTNRTMLIYCHEDDTRLLNEAMNFFVGQQVDAMVMAGMPEAADFLTPYIDNDIPVVIYNNDVRGPRVDRVFVDNLKASVRAVSHLIDTGYRKVAMCAGRDLDTSGEQRRLGYELALKKRGLPLREDYVVCGDWTVEGGYSAAQSLMSLSDPPTAIFSASYRMTIGILEWMREHGLSTPQDLAIVSFDDVDLFRLYDQGITAVSQPIAQIAETIASYVGSRINSADVADIRSRTLECSIILRGSSGHPT